ncbi:hypothetical protein HDV06_000325 [Boothiomyces sp. JEL0866]|nr:hypothetical protein HDV06_000325 [Boothiomyces sp. JEL0866]
MFPLDLINILVQYLPHQELKNLSLVNKLFHRAVLPALWKDFEITPRNMNTTLSRVCLMKAFRSNSNIALPFYYLSQFNTTNLETYLVTASAIELILKYTTLKHVELYWIQLEAEQYLFSNITYLNTLLVYSLFADSINLNIKGLQKLVLNKPSTAKDNIRIDYEKLLHLNLTFTNCDQLFTLKHLNLQELHLKSTLPVITDERFKTLIDACVLLKELHLEDHGVGDSSLKYLNKSQCRKKLEYLGIVRRASAWLPEGVECIWKQD